jgi:hypothetical protein
MRGPLDRKGAMLVTFLNGVRDSGRRGREEGAKL